MLKILLVISIFLNVVLYYGWLDIGQYKSYVDSTIELGKSFSESDEFKEMKNNTKELGTQIVDEALKDQDIEKLQEDLENGITDTVKDELLQDTSIK